MSILVETFEPLSLVLGHLSRRDGDANDRLNYKYSPTFFMVLGIVVIFQHLVGDPIKCWTPAQFTDSWVEYANLLCWVSNKIHIPMTEMNILTAPRRIITYYQWVPLALLAQGVLFYAPSVPWRLASRAFGVDVHKIVSTIAAADHINPTHRDKSVKYLVRHLDRTFASSRQIGGGCCPKLRHCLASSGCLCGKRHGNVAVIVYMIVKGVYIANVAFQLWFLNHFLGTNYVAYGYEALRDLAVNGTSQESSKFPRVTLCEFEIRDVGKHHPYTVQCTLPVNLFNEKIYIVVWFWLVLVGLANIGSFLGWTLATLQESRRRFVRQILKVFGRYDKARDAKMMAAFCDRYLRQDGLFMIRLLAKNTNGIIAGELVAELWENYSRNYTLEMKAVNL